MRKNQSVRIKNFRVRNGGKGIEKLTFCAKKCRKGNRQNAFFIVYYAQKITALKLPQEMISSVGITEGGVVRT